MLNIIWIWFDMKNQFRAKKFYFIGIGGIGMSGLAEILLRMGHKVSGSDRQLSEVTEYLVKIGALIHEGHRAEQVKETDFVVYTAAVHENNPELQEAKKRRIPVMRRAELLGQLFNRKFGIAVAGTHGKTTTTSMIGQLLISTAMDPTIIVGGRLMNLRTNARLGFGDLLVAEADEYDRSFLTMMPRIAVLTSLEMDHQDIYRDLDDLEQTFLQFTRQVAFDGVTILNDDDPNLQGIVDKIPGTVVRFSTEHTTDFSAGGIECKNGVTHFELFDRQGSQGIFYLNVPGKHNVKNALATIAVARELQIPFEQIRDALVQFKGVERRFQIIGEGKGIIIVDDYAHHPTEVEATLESAKTGWPERRIVAVFQPHLYSRTQSFHQDFARVLSRADLTVVTDVYPARERPVPGVNGQLIVEGLTNEGYYVADKHRLADFLLSRLHPNDMVLFLGAGDITNESKTLLKRITE